MVVPKIAQLHSSTYNIRVVSEKGGVGKTTISVNLAMALAKKGYKVLLGDGDMINPSVLYYLDLGNFRYASNDVYDGLVTQEQATVRYANTNLYVIPARPTYVPKLPSIMQLNRAYTLLKKAEEKISYDFLITDTPPGFSPSPSLKFYAQYGGFIIVANPTLPSAMSAIRMSRRLKSAKANNFLVCNRIKKSSTEISIAEIEGAYGAKVSAVIPESYEVEKALHIRKPAVISYPKSKFAHAINQLADLFAEKAKKYVSD